MNSLPFKKKNLAVNLFSGVFLVTLSSQAVLAEEKKTDLDMISVVGQATSGLDSVITEEQLEAAQANDLGDIFRRDPSVTAGGSVKLEQKIYVRNIGEDILNITVDGAEQANAVFHHSGRIAIEPELLKRVEVEAGAGSATAGPGALGGAIRFTTKDPEDLLKPGQNIGGILKTDYFSNGEGSKVNATVYGRDNADRFSAMVSLTGSDFDNVEDGNGDEILGSESKEKLGYTKLVANLTDEQYVSISYEKVEHEGDILYRPDLIASARNVPEPTEAERTTTTFNYGYTPENNDLVDISLTVYNTERMQEREFRGVSFDGAVESTGVTLQNTSLFSGNKLIYGINYRDDKSYLNDIDFPADPYFEETGEVKGVYIQDIINLGDKVTIATGLRYDDYEVDDGDGLELSDDGVSPNLSANYAITPNLSISAGYAEAFRGVEVEDSFRLSTSSYDEDLEAETAKNTELGLDYKKGNFSIGAGVYRTVIEDLILRTPPWSRVVTNLDDDLEIEGYFINLGYDTKRMSISANYHSADSEVDGETATRYVYSSKATSIGDTLVLDAHYKLTDKFQAGWLTEYVKGIDGIEQVVGGENLTVDKKGYTIHDLYLRWMPLKDDLLTINLAVSNLFDKQYLSHASVEDYRDNSGFASVSGSPEAGRDIRVSAKLRF